MAVEERTTTGATVLPAPLEDKGAAYEKLAFNFCKAATLMLLTAPLRQFALPTVAAIAACFYLLAYAKGQQGTRCILGKTLIVGAFWGVVSLLSFGCALWPLLHK